MHSEVREPESIEGDIDLYARAAVEDEVDAGEGEPVGLRREAGASRAVVERLVAVHLRHRPHVHEAAEAVDRLVEVDQVRVALAVCDLLHRDPRHPHCPGPADPEMQHRNRCQLREKPVELRPPGHALLPAEKDVLDRRLLSRLGLEARRIAGDSEQELRDLGAGAGPGRQSENNEDTNEKPLHRRERIALTTFSKANSSSGGMSSGKNQRSSATSSAGVGSPETIRAVQ